jgi:uncharacterized membrane protein YraQ (UPF0718 family)/copper chaperone CopZ
MAETYLDTLWTVLLELSPALLLGLLLAGLLRVFFPDTLVRAHLSQPTFGSSVRAAIVGVPMPLCSCGVIPAAIGLRMQGASKGATTSFMISTPQTGVDSVLVSAAFLGWPFAIFKLAAAFVSGVIGGSLVDRLTGNEEAGRADSGRYEHWRSTNSRLVAVFRYAIFDILAAIDLWLIVGVLLAAAVTTAIPADYLQGLAWTQGLGGMLLVLAISLPLYVCTTSSVPIAASLIAAGMPAGTALVFLMAGPATNVATIGAVYRALGARVLGLYLGTVIVASVSLGMTFDFLLDDGRADVVLHAHETGAWWETASALLLLGLMAFLIGRRGWQRLAAKPVSLTNGERDLTLHVEGMTCQHCVTNVRRALQSLNGVEQVAVDLGSGTVRVRGGRLRREELAGAVSGAGYRVVDL